MTNTKLYDLYRKMLEVDDFQSIFLSAHKTVFAEYDIVFSESVNAWHSIYNAYSFNARIIATDDGFEITPQVTPNDIKFKTLTARTIDECIAITSDLCLSANMVEQKYFDMEAIKNHINDIKIEYVEAGIELDDECPYYTTGEGCVISRETNIKQIPDEWFDK